MHTYAASGHGAVIRGGHFRTRESQETRSSSDQSSKRSEFRKVTGGTRTRIRSPGPNRPQVVCSQRQLAHEISNFRAPGPTHARAGTRHRRRGARGTGHRVAFEGLRHDTGDKADHLRTVIRPTCERPGRGPNSPPGSRGSSQWPRAAEPNADGSRPGHTPRPRRLPGPRQHGRLSRWDAGSRPRSSRRSPSRRRGGSRSSPETRGAPRRRARRRRRPQGGPGSRWR